MTDADEAIARLLAADLSATREARIEGEVSRAVIDRALELLRRMS